MPSNDGAHSGPLEILLEIPITDDLMKMHRAWPGLAIVPNGDLVLTYKESTDHNRTDDGALIVARSSDGGQTWPIRKAIAAEPGRRAYTNHSLTRLSEGTLLSGKNSIDPHGIRHRYTRCAYVRSNDDGHSWMEEGEPIHIPFVNATERMAAYGQMVELADGRLMVSVYGVPRNILNFNLRALGVAFSLDRGRTWTSFRLIYEDRKGDICPSETDLLRLPDGHILAMIRANAAHRLYRSYSDDEGETWSPIEPTELPGQCPCLHVLASGAIVCAYRDMREGKAGVSYGVSEDSGKTWKPCGHLYRGSNRDCAYPSMVTLPDGNIYCVFYTAAEPEYAGVCNIHGLLLRDKTAP